MENNKIRNKNKFLLLAFLCVCWFLPYISFIIAYQTEVVIQTMVTILAFIVTTVFYYICKNRILRLLVMIAAIVCLTVVIGYKYMLTVYPAFAVIYVYKSFVTEVFENKKINIILLTLAPVTAIAGLIINFKETMNRISEIGGILTAFAILYLIMRKYANGKKTNKKTKKSHKTKELEINIKTFYQNIFSISIIGVLSSAISYSFTQDITSAFFPWFFFIALLIYEEDKSLHSATEMIVNKIKAFLE